MKKNSFTSQAGFTLSEMAIAITLMALLFPVIFEALGPALKYSARVETDSKIKEIKAALIAAYKDNSTAIESEGAARFTTSDGSMIPVLPAQTGGRVCLGTADNLKAISRYLQTSANAAFRDGFGKSFCVYITARQNFTLYGNVLTFHSVAVVSAGSNGTIETGTSMSSDGILTTAGDDIGVVVDGRTLMADKVMTTMAQITKVADAYGIYFSSQFLSNSMRDVSIDYFSVGDRNGNKRSVSFDLNGVMPNTLNQGARMNVGSPSPMTVLGLTLADVTDAFGNVLYIDNSSDAIRSPDNTSSSLRRPAFTAQVYTILPNGGRLLQTVVGKY
jgi:prepilin-type N-terminal cleavage/methylation domain-containing protein